jgi:hypothetical protein
MSKDIGSEFEDTCATGVKLARTCAAPYPMRVAGCPPTAVSRPAVRRSVTSLALHQVRNDSGDNGCEYLGNRRNSFAVDIGRFPQYLRWRCCLWPPPTHRPRPSPGQRPWRWTRQRTPPATGLLCGDRRTVADVSAVADPLTGVAVCQTRRSPVRRCTGRPGCTCRSTRSSRR